MSADAGTIDITNVVNNMQSTFVLLAKNFLMAEALAIPGLGPIAAWFIKTLGDPFITWLLTRLSTWGVMQAFFLNTAVKKASQAADYQAAVDAKNNLPDTVSDADYAKAEQNEMDKFRNFVLVTN